MYKYLFGPVPSRRLGMSLGVDLVPKKVCSLNCVYCEVGQTTKLTTEQKEYIPAKKIIFELENYFSASPDPDYVTFSGYGEPTLNSGIGIIIEYLKKEKPEIPVAVLTNGTLLNRKEVSRALQNADLVLPSLDAATQGTFEKINRPALGIDVIKCINGLIDFSAEFNGKIWLEVFILPGYNNSPNELNELKKAIEKIAPDKIQLNTLDRPGVIKGLRVATEQELKKIINLWQLPNVEIIAKVQARKDLLSYRTDIETTIVETISRRPCTCDDLAKILGTHVNEINKYLEILENTGEISHIRQNGKIFFQVSK